MTAQVTSEAKTASILDVVVVLAESWRLLFIGCFASGLAMFLVAQHQPKLYESHAVVALQPTDMAALRDPRVIDAALASSGFSGPQNIAEARNYVLSGLQVSDSGLPLAQRTDQQVYDPLKYVGSQSTVALSYPDAAKVRVVLDALLHVFAKDSGQMRFNQLRMSIKLQIDDLKAAANAQDAAIGSLKKVYASEIANGGATPTDFATAFNALAAQATQQRLRANALQQLMDRLPSGLVVTPPSKAVLEGRDPAMFAAIAGMLFAGATLVIFVFARAALRTTVDTADGRAKLLRIRRSLSLRSFDQNSPDETT